MKRLTNEDAERILSMYRITSCSMARLAQHFETSQTTVAKIIAGKWSEFVPKVKRNRDIDKRA